jgi:hypothetical protein
VLAAVALFCWLVPIATVYPPGALTVELHDTSFDTNFNVSMFHVNDAKRDTNTLSHISCDDSLGPPGSDESEAPNDQAFLETCRLGS